MAAMTTESEMRRAYVTGLRKKMNLTQQEMADHLGMSVRAYSDVENGVSECRLIHLLAVERITIKQAWMKDDPKLIANPVVQEIRAVVARGL